MFTGISKTFQKPKTPHVTPDVPKNQRIYCTGDIPGRADLLETLHNQIQSVAKRRL
jgi:hypothetical protein